MGRAKIILVYSWFFIAIFGSIMLAVSLKVAFFIAIFSISCGIVVVALSAKRQESTAGIERLIRLSTWLEKGLSYRSIQIITHLILMPIVLLQKLGCRVFNKRYEHHFGDIMLRPVDEVMEEYHAAVILFPYAVMATVGLVILLISRNG